MDALSFFKLSRETPFSYVCNRCLACCYGKRIPLTPFDLIRLADVLQIDTGKLIREHTEDGIALRVQEDVEGGPCVFLGPEGCTVHAGRPAACRIYPLGRSCTSEGVEGFAMVEPHPETKGEYGENGTIGDFLEGQGLEPCFEASAQYLQLFKRLQTRTLPYAEAESADLGEEEPHVLDVDAVVQRYCARHELPVPTDPVEKMHTHIAAVDEWIVGN